MNELCIFDLSCGSITKISNWTLLAQKTIEMSNESNDYERFLPFLNGTPLDFPHKGEDVKGYEERLIELAASLPIVVR